MAKKKSTKFDYNPFLQGLFETLEKVDAPLFEKESAQGVGRPPIIDRAALAKLRTAYLMGCTDKEACVNAGIHPATLYRYQEQNPEFCERKEAWKNLPILYARLVVVMAILGGDVHVSWKYLKSKRASEFDGFKSAKPGAKGKPVTAKELEDLNQEQSE
jgi:hypothetical protein